MRYTKALSTLDIQFLSEYTTIERSAIYSAFRSSYSLESLRLSTDEADVATAILYSLRLGHTSPRFEALATRGDAI
jgi:hypothetical protein